MSDADARAAARAIDALRRGWPITIAAPGEAPLPLLAVETADAGRLAGFAPDGRWSLLISGGRAETLKLVNQRDAQPDRPVMVEQAPRGSISTAHERSPIHSSIWRPR